MSAKVRFARARALMDAQTEAEHRLAKLGVEPARVLRKRDKAYKALGLTGKEPADALIGHLAANPGMLERPIGVVGDRAVVGAWESSTLGYAAGAAYVFVRSGTTWTQQAYLKASNAEAFDYFGCSIALSGDTLDVALDLITEMDIKDFYEMDPADLPALHDPVAEGRADYTKGNRFFNPFRLLDYRSVTEIMELIATGERATWPVDLSSTNART